MTKIERVSLEQDRKLLIKETIRYGKNNTFSWINYGAIIFNAYNQGDSDEKNRFVLCITLDSVH